MWTERDAGARGVFPEITHRPRVLPQSLELSSAKILATIASQNAELQANIWKVVQREKEGALLHLVLAIDDASMKRLNFLKGKINYRFNFAKLILKSTDKVSASDSGIVETAKAVPLRAVKAMPTLPSSSSAAGHVTPDDSRTTPMEQAATPAFPSITSATGHGDQNVCRAVPNKQAPRPISSTSSATGHIGPTVSGNTSANLPARPMGHRKESRKTSAPSTGKVTGSPHPSSGATGHAYRTVTEPARSRPQGLSTQAACRRGKGPKMAQILRQARS